MEEIRRSKNVILFIDELHTIWGAVRRKYDDASNLSSRPQPCEMQFIGATTLNE